MKMQLIDKRVVLNALISRRKQLENRMADRPGVMSPPDLERFAEVERLIMVVEQLPTIDKEDKRITQKSG